MRVKITSKRQVTFPAKVLTALGVAPGDHLYLSETPQGLLIQSQRINRELLAPLRGKIDPKLEPFDLEAFRSQSYDQSLRD